MTTEHDEGFAAAIEAALAEVTRFAGHDTTRLLIQRIRALKPAPRSAEPSAKDIECGRQRAIEMGLLDEPPAQGERGPALEEFLQEIAACGIAWRRLPAVERALNTYLLATAPSTRIQRSDDAHE